MRNRHLVWVWLALALGFPSASAFADGSALAGREVFVSHCRTCHGGIGLADVPIGPRLDAIFGAKAGTRPGGTHSRATLESNIVWDRDTLRGFLSSPRRVIPNAMMPDATLEAGELESLLDYLESLE